MARKGSKDRGVTFKHDVWWVRLYVHGREKWYRCQTKISAETNTFPKKNDSPFISLRPIMKLPLIPRGMGE
jgi:hypothetical protein